MELKSVLWQCEQMLPMCCLRFTQSGLKGHLMRAAAYTLFQALLLALFTSLIVPSSAFAQALTMDGQSGIFFQPWADVVPSPQRKIGAPTIAYHAVTASPVAGDYFNVSLEEGYGNWLEFGYTRGNHTDGGDPSYSQLFNYAGMNTFNVKAKVIAGGAHKSAWLPVVAVGGVLRTNVPYISQTFAKKNATNGDIYGVATKLVVFKKKLPLLFSAGVRGTNAEVYGYGGNATNWQARAFGALSVPIPFRRVLLSPTIEVDQEPHHLAYVTYANIPTTLIYAVRITPVSDARWTVDIGTGHVGSDVAPGINLKANNALALALDFRF
jgi:hypothetical protein